MFIINRPSRIRILGKIIVGYIKIMKSHLSQYCSLNREIQYHWLFSHKIPAVSTISIGSLTKKLLEFRKTLVVYRPLTQNNPISCQIEDESVSIDRTRAHGNHPHQERIITTRKANLWTCSSCILGCIIARNACNHNGNWRGGCVQIVEECTATGSDYFP